ncbi:hypothetical protein ACIQOU_19105 [Streptomyces sp. NPDC091279]|uniref:hypothetical protein n=1 Tax=unclassified Streptomyces TaxID=2593676 RepID=UPI00380B311D
MAGRVRGARGRRVLAAVGLVTVAVGATAACDPTGGLSSATVAYTTDQAATEQLKQQRIGVQWLTCNGDYGDRGATPTPSAGATTVVSVDCRGRTTDGKDITVDGQVTRAVSGACVRGDLTAKVGGKQVFHVTGLGNCDATPSAISNPTYGGGSRPTVTVTVTRTVWCVGDPQCGPVAGK